MNYIEFDFTIVPKETGSEILTAMLADIGFESFTESEKGLISYIQESKFSVDMIEQLDIMHNKEFSIKYNYKTIQDKNWNEEWERSYNAVVISDICCIRAPFHPKNENCKLDIIIEPNMSFGTAHHETTALMIEQILLMDIKGKSVLDVGCGTAVLSAVAAKKGATAITGIDIDEWAYNNSIENIERNKFNFIKVLFGDIQMAKETYDVIFANINRNIIIRDLPEYIKRLNKNGILLMSGFYEVDIPVVSDKAEANGLKLLTQSLKNNWAVLKYKKNN